MPEPIFDDATNKALQYSIENCFRHLVRSLLDFTDMEMAHQQDAASAIFWEKFKKRIHNDVGMAGQQVIAAVEIVRMGGVIPPFGRTEAQMAQPNGRRQGR